MKFLLPWLASIALILCGCGDDAKDYTLSNGLDVRVSDDGRFSLSTGGRSLWSMARGQYPSARVFDDEPVGALGIWEFHRTGESQTSMDKFTGASLSDDELVLDYRGGEQSGRIRITPAGENVTRIRFEVDGPATSLALPAACDSAGSFLGFGGQYNGTNQKGESFNLFVSEQGIGRTGDPLILTGNEHTTYFPMPYYLDARGFGVLLQTARRVEVDLCQTDPKTAWLEVIDGEPLELLIFHGPTPKDVIAQLGERVGRPSRPPSWAFDLWISAQGGQAAVLAQVDALEAAQIPVGAIWSQDWTGERPNADGGKGVQYRWEVDVGHYPDLSGMVAALKSRGIRFLAYANPFIDPELPNHYQEMADAGLLIHDQSGNVYQDLAPNGRASQPDLTNVAAQNYVKDAMRAMVRDHGIDGWMADFGEWLPLDASLSDGSDPLAYHNLYPVDWHRMWREVMDQERPDGDFAVIARSGWTGVHAYSQIHWVGDQETSFSETDGLPTVVPAMINLGLSGIPYVTHDIAGFSSLDGASSKELFMRWTELGAFTPVMRTHEGSLRDENWGWQRDQETTEHFRAFVLIHQALKEDLLAAASEAEAGVPMVRHMLLEFPEDPEVIDMSDQYLLGPDLLVAPVVSKGAVTKELYLPEGSWFHLWTGEEFQGPARITIDAPLGEPPVFSRHNDRPEFRALQPRQ
jgi:alpha-glucosidase